MDIAPRQEKDTQSLHEAEQGYIGGNEDVRE